MSFNPNQSGDVKNRKVKVFFEKKVAAETNIFRIGRRELEERKDGRKLELKERKSERRQEEAIIEERRSRVWRDGSESERANKLPARKKGRGRIDRVSQRWRAAAQAEPSRAEPSCFLDPLTYASLFPPLRHDALSSLICSGRSAVRAAPEGPEANAAQAAQLR